MTLANKFEIDDAAELARVEERISKRNALKIFTEGRLKNFPAGKFIALAEIHRILFGEIYDFAGKIRTDNIAKGYFRFAAALYLTDAVSHVENMSQKNFDEIVAKYVEMNVAHPFRDDAIKKILGAALTDKVDDREIFIKGIDASYFYENYFAYRTRDL